MKTKALYGFAPERTPFAGKSAAVQAALLRDWGATAVFGGYQDHDFVAAAHAAGLKVYAEFGCFQGQRWWQEIPESRPITADGRPLEPEEWYYGVNPTVLVVRQKQLAALETLLRDHPVDGVWLDFIRWPCHWEDQAPNLPLTSFDEPTLNRFSHDTGTPVPTDIPAAARQLLGPDRDAWTAWRCDQITSWVAEARAIVERVRPGVLLGLFGLPWRPEDFDGAILEIVGQDYRALGRYVDVVSPMVYHAMCHRPVAWIGEVAAAIGRLSRRPVWPIIQSVDEPRPLSAEEYHQALAIALNGPASQGVIIFTLAGTLEAPKLAATQAAFAASYPGS